MRRVGRDDAEAAYFTLLRAREEVANLQRYQQYLSDERTRLQRSVVEGQALDERVDRRLRRALTHTDKPLADVIAARLTVVADELARLPERVAAAERFVEECEAEIALLRGA